MHTVSPEQMFVRETILEAEAGLQFGEQEWPKAKLSTEGRRRFVQTPSELIEIKVFKSSYCLRLQDS